jgi:hypothetical protein
LSSIGLPYPLADRPPVANPAGREYGGKNFDIKIQKDVDGMLPLVRYNEVKNHRKSPRQSRRRNGETLEKIDIEETIKINPV